MEEQDNQQQYQEEHQQQEHVQQEHHEYQQQEEQKQEPEVQLPQLDESQKKIIKYIIKNAAYGETQEVISDLKKIVDDLRVEDPFIQNLLREHNEEHLAIATGHGTSFILNQVSSQNDGQYYIDQINKKKIFVDQLTLQITAVEDIDIQVNEGLEQYRQKLTVLLKKYLYNYYKDSAQFYINIDWSEDNFTIYICITCKNLNLKNYHGGEWISQWSLDREKFSGQIKINSHFFEEGNVALKENRNYNEPFSLSGQDIDLETKNIVKIIEQVENKIQSNLEQMYDQMSDKFFKGMRRLLPLTNQKMDWNIHVHKMLQGLKIQ